MLSAPEMESLSESDELELDGEDEKETLPRLRRLRLRRLSDSAWDEN